MGKKKIRMVDIEGQAKEQLKIKDICALKLTNSDEIAGIMLPKFTMRARYLRYAPLFPGY